jgi:hypothetical protein
MPHEFSAVTVAGIVRALKAFGWFDEVLAAVGPVSRAALESPQATKYHPGPAMDEVMARLMTLHGETGPEQVMQKVTQQSLEGIVAPLARVFLSLTGNSPRVLFSRFDALLSATARGLHASWVDDAGEQGGTLTILYDLPTTRAMASAWKGALQHVLIFCRTTGTISIRDSLQPHSVVLHASWA